MGLYEKFRQKYGQEDGEVEEFQPDIAEPLTKAIPPGPPTEGFKEEVKYEPLDYLPVLNPFTDEDMELVGKLYPKFDPETGRIVERFTPDKFPNKTVSKEQEMATRPAGKSQEMPKVILPNDPKVPSDLDDMLKDFVDEKKSSRYDTLVKLCNSYYTLAIR